MYNRSGRKRYSSSFREDWVVPGSHEIPTPKSIISPDLGCSGEGLSNHSDSQKSGSDAEKTELPPSTDGEVGRKFVVSERPRAKPRYSSFHANDWTVACSTDGESTTEKAIISRFQIFNVPKVAASRPVDEKNNNGEGPSIDPQQKPSPGSTSKAVSSVREQTSSLPQPPSTASPSSSNWGYDAPPKPPFLTSSYSPSTTGTS